MEEIGYLDFDPPNPGYTSQDMNGAQQGMMKDELKQAITQLGLDYRIMTQFTSFVAVEEMIVTEGGKPRRIDVPVDDLYQIQVNSNVNPTIEISGTPVQLAAGDGWRFAPASLARGEHHLRIRGKVGDVSRLDFRLGAAGTRRVAASTVPVSCWRRCCGWCTPCCSSTASRSSSTRCSAGCRRATIRRPTSS